MPVLYCSLVYFEKLLTLETRMQLTFGLFAVPLSSNF